MNPLWNISDWVSAQGSSWALVLIVYLLSQLINCILSTMKSILLIKGTRVVAVIVNTLSYAVGAIITFIIGNVVNNIWLVLLITIISNLIGVSFGLWVTDHFKKDRLWRISATVKTEHYDELLEELKSNQIKFVTFTTDWEKIRLLDLFSTTRKQSEAIYKIFKKYDVKYTISENTNQLF